MPARDVQTIYGTSHFRVLIAGRELGFAEVSRLSSETDAAPPGEKPSHHFDSVVLRRALTRSTELYDWRRVTIHQLDAAGGEIVNSWRLERAWPRRWSGPVFNANGNDIAIEELELAYEDLVWPAEPSPPPRPPK
jgi:phage tail-like protein